MKRVLAVVFFLVLGSGIFLVLQSGFDWKALSPADVRAFMEPFGSMGGAVFVAAYIINIIILFPPIALLSLSAGVIFGKVWGSLYLLIGATAGTACTFLISRYLGRSYVREKLGGKIKELDDNLGRNGFLSVLFLRLVPVVPFEVMNYGCGLTGIRFGSYVTATFLGTVPWVIALALYGDQIGELSSFKEVFSTKFLLITAVFVVIYLSPLIYKKMTARKKI